MFLSIITDHIPARAAMHVNASLPQLASNILLHLNYNVQFHKLATSDFALCWDA